MANLMKFIKVRASISFEVIRARNGPKRRLQFFFAATVSPRASCRHTQSTTRSTPVPPTRRRGCFHSAGTISAGGECSTRVGATSTAARFPASLGSGTPPPPLLRICRARPMPGSTLLRRHHRVRQPSTAPRVRNRDCDLPHGGVFGKCSRVSERGAAFPAHLLLPHRAISFSMGLHTSALEIYPSNVFSTKAMLISFCLNYMSPEINILILTSVGRVV